MNELLEIMTDKKFKYKLLLLLSTAIHLTFLIIFLITKLYVLMVVNIASVTFYTIGFIQSIKGSIDKHNIGWVTAIYLEITIHSVLCTIWIGFETCFFIYMLEAVSTGAYIVYLACPREKFWKLFKRFATITLSALIFCFLYFMCFNTLNFITTGNYLEQSVITTMMNINIAYGAMITIMFAFLSILELNYFIEKLHISNEQLQFSATHDALTGLYNRRSLYDKFNVFDKNNKFCVVMSDIDNFKKVNDTYGHQCGDEVLKAVSNIIKDNINENEIACRWGGEEFLLIIIGSHTECLNRVEEIRKQVFAKIIKSEDTELTVTMTFGLADCSESMNEVNIDKLTKISDSRLYFGKNNGKNRVIDYDVA